MTRSPTGSEFSRFGIVTVTGLAIDLSLAWTLATFAGFPLPVAALSGFLVAAGVNYCLHELWTFKSGEKAISARRGLTYLVGLGLTIAIRLAVVTFMARYVFTEPSGRLPSLVAGIGCSFVANYLFSKFLVFRTPPAPKIPGVRDMQGSRE